MSWKGSNWRKCSMYRELSSSSCESNKSKGYFNRRFYQDKFVHSDSELEAFDTAIKPWEVPWTKWWCRLRGNEWLCEVDKGFIRDYNMEGIAEYIPENNLKYALETVKGLKPDPDRMDLCFNDTDGYLNRGCSSASDHFVEVLYGLIHARFLMTAEGTALMREKYEKGVFGNCPRVYCENQKVLPIGVSDEPGKDSVKVYCPRCEDVYDLCQCESDLVQPDMWERYWRSAPHRHRYHADGAFFGQSFPHQFFMDYPELRPEKPTRKFIPRLYGMEIHPKAIQYQLRGEEKEIDYSKIKPKRGRKRPQEDNYQYIRGEKLYWRR